MTARNELRASVLFDVLFDYLVSYNHESDRRLSTSVTLIIPFTNFGVVAVNDKVVAAQGLSFSSRSNSYCRSGGDWSLEIGSFRFFLPQN